MLAIPNSIQVKMYPAKNGDSFLIKTYDSKESVSILVDGGYSSTFNSVIKSDLEDLEDLNLVIASHIDADHVLGVLELFKNNGKADSSNIVKINKVWHNSLRSITGQSSEKEVQPKGAITYILKRGFPVPRNEQSDEISAKQGSSLAARLLAGKYNWNEGKGLSSINSNTTEECHLNSCVSISVIGPTLNRLDKLKAWWIKQLKQMGHFATIKGNVFYDDAFEFLCADEKLQIIKKPEEISHKSRGEDLSQCYKKDDSVVNASSISFILNWKDKKLLFLADSWAEDIEDEISQISSGEKLMFDCIKVSHHGSHRNTSPRLLNLIDSKIFLISTNGDKHGHPELSVLKAIVNRPADFERELYFNYSTEASKALKEYRPNSGQSFKVIEKALDWIKV